MQQETFTVKNVKCGGCVANIEKGLGEIAGVEHVQVNLDGGVTVEGRELSRKALADKLHQMGYPEA